MEESADGNLSLALSSAGSRALIVGTGTHIAGSVLPEIPAVSATVTDLGQALVEHCGLDATNLRVLVDPADPITLGTALTEVTAAATDVLLVYYVGHGLVSAGNELHLATTATDDHSVGLAFKALPFSAVRDALARCRAASIMVVLDCCFAGRAYGSLGSPAADGFTAAQLRGSYLLAAAAHDEAALAGPGEPHTAFSGALLRLLRDGDPTGPPVLTPRHVFRFLSRQLPAGGFPGPQRHVGGNTDDLALALNPAYVAAQPRHELRPGPEGAETSPYRGLAAFGPQDARYFFGRERLTGELLDLLAEAVERPGPVAVIGPSGSGKSSLLNAGLLPALRRGELPVSGSSTWPHRVLTPGPHPVRRLADQLGTSDPGRLAEVIGDLLVHLAGGRDTSGARLVLVIDQFEELFTACRDEQERQEFVRALSAIGDIAVVVIGVRADFYGHCLAYPQLTSALRDRPLPVGPMTEKELRATIEKPAKAAGLTLEPGLTELLLRDLRAGQDSGTTLPLLSYALLATWQRRAGRELTMAGYHEAGGIWDSVARQADTVYATLSPDGQRAAQRMLLRMVRLGEGTEDTRRRVGPTDFTGPDVAQARDALASARLISLDADGAEITHEALLRAWTRLRDWIEADRTGLLVGQRLVDAAQAWHRENRDPTTLYAGSRLVAARDWVAAGGQIGPLEQEFLYASTAREDEEHDAVRRRTRRLRRLVTALAMSLAVALTATGLALWARQTAVDNGQRAADNARAALSRQFAAQASLVRSTDPQRAMLLALAAWRADSSTVEARSILLSVQEDAFDGELNVASNTAETVQAAVFSPDGRMIVTGGTDGYVRLWDVAAHRQIAALHGDGELIKSLAFSRDGRTLAVGRISAHGLTRWDVATHQETGPDSTAQAVTALAYSPDGTLLATAEGSTIQLRDAATDQVVATLTGNAQFRSVAFSPDGHLVASGGLDNTVRVWDTATHAPVAVLADHTQPVTAVAFSPDGRLLASASLDRTIGLWDTTTHTAPSPLTSTSPINALAFSPDSTALLSGGVDAKVRRWDLASGTELSQWVGYGKPIYALAFSPDGHTVVSSGAGPTAMLWSFQQAAIARSNKQMLGVAISPDARMVATAGAAAGAESVVRLFDVATRRLIRVVQGHQGSVRDLAFSPDGHLLASASNDGTARLWDPATGAPLGVLPAGLSVKSVVFSPDGTTLAVTTGADIETAANQASAIDKSTNTLQLWDVRSHQLLAKLTPPDVYWLSTPAYTPDGSLIAAATGLRLDGPIRLQLWNAHSHQNLPDFTKDGARMTFLVFSPDGHTLALGREDGTIELWNATTRQRVRTLTGNASPAHYLTFSPDGHTLAASSQDQYMRLWNAEDGQLMATLDAHNARVNQLAFSSDGHLLASASADGTALLWNLDLNQAQQRLCEALHGPDLAQQWSQLSNGLDTPPC